MTIVVPSSYGGCDEWGWSPESRTPVRDVGDEVNLVTRGRAVLRLGAAVGLSWPQKTEDGERLEEVARALAASGDENEARQRLAQLAIDPGVARWVRLAARLLARDTGLRLVPHQGMLESEVERAAGLCGSRWHRIDSREAVEDFFQENSSSARTVDVPLEAHLDGCREKAAGYARGCGLPERLARTVAWAARLHDIGKADPRFQRWLRGGVPLPDAAGLLAKSGLNGRDRSAMEQARRLAGYPDGSRHELLSVALADACPLPGGEDVDRELLLHLIASHHGRCRPFAPFVPEGPAIEVQYNGLGERLAVSSCHGLESAGSGVSERFWRLSRRYGWYGLAYLEALVRLADCRRSEEEQLRRPNVRGGNDALR